MHALITGASSGIGEALAREFAKAGWSLTLAARREDRLKALAGQLKAPSFVRPSDLSRLDQCGPLWREAEAALGPVDLLINNAGIQYVEPTVGVSDERAEALMTVDVLAPMRLARLAVVSMLERKRGGIVNIASVAAINPTPGMYHYNAAKAALAAASESLRVELRGTGVSVVTVYPGPVSSEMEAAARASFEPSAATRNIPTGSAEGLAQKVRRAVERDEARVVYPAFYNLSRHFRLTSQWATDTFTPPLKKG